MFKRLCLLLSSIVMGIVAGVPSEAGSFGRAERVSVLTWDCRVWHSCPGAIGDEQKRWPAAAGVHHPQVRQMAA